MIVSFMGVFLSFPSQPGPPRQQGWPLLARRARLGNSFSAPVHCMVMHGVMHEVVDVMRVVRLVMIDPVPGMMMRVGVRCRMWVRLGPGRLGLDVVMVVVVVTP